tara:strand:- start:16571 stop:16864 length:294 start_codon:yes stop_codon:yes gene_type:complete
MNAIIRFVISISVLFAILIVGFTTTTGLHARIPSSEFYVAPNKDIYECRLQWINENLPPNLMCLYKCEDTHSTFEWYEKSWDQKGCKLKTRVYKSQV